MSFSVGQRIVKVRVVKREIFHSIGVYSAGYSNKTTPSGHRAT